jgi:membrane fusion protein, copper/silver efflux system
MFVDVELPVQLPAGLTVPADAIIDSGLRKTVFVNRGNGYFEPRRVETGWRVGDQVEIVKGLSPGDRIVTSGNFLIDSESRMKLANDKPATAEKAKKVKDLACGMDIDPEAPGTVKTEYKGKSYYFCSKLCKKEFEANPEKYIHKGMEGQNMHGTGMAE